MNNNHESEAYNRGFTTALREMAALIESNPRPVDEIISAMRKFADVVESSSN